MPLISIITPCYNHGVYLDEAIGSLKQEKFRNVFELIIVNDGSTDPFTLNKLAELKQLGYKIIDQENKGLAEARNTAIKYASGKYILPLDCDNKIVPEVFIEASKKLENNIHLDVVYTDAVYFGEINQKWYVGEFSLKKMLYCNYIDACTLIRKETLLKYGGYNGGMPAMGHEDWELWLKIALNGGRFFYLRKLGFYYRVLSNSMSATVSNPGFLKNREYIYCKHSNLIAEFIRSLEKKSQLRTLLNRIKGKARRIFN